MTVVIEPGDFAAVEVNRDGPNRCSPPPQGDDWRGIAIRGPSRLRVPRGLGYDALTATIPICGFYRFSLDALDGKGAMRLVAVDQASGAVFSGAVVDLDPSPVLPEPDLGPVRRERLIGRAVGSHFNPNLTDFVRLPPRAASYAVHVEFCGHRSNPVAIDVVEEP